MRGRDECSLHLISFCSVILGYIEFWKNLLLYNKRVKRGTHAEAVTVRIVVVVTATVSVQIIRIVSIIRMAGTQPEQPDASNRPKRQAYIADFPIKLCKLSEARDARRWCQSTYYC